MSMLAERKIKQKWSLNPRGKEWAQDSNKFGQKMLEKMGWQHGKGLGPNGKGITEHIKVSYKNDSKGMGYKETDNQWTEHEDNFTSLLASLSGTVEKSDELKLTSLEKKSQTSRARVHYHKFTRGKDLSRYSEKDLANIFGKKTLVDIKKEAKEEQSDGNEEKIKSESAFLLNAGSMRDYFKKKLPNFSNRTNGYEVGHNGVLKRKDSESESEMAPSFGFGYKQKDDAEHSNFMIKNEATSDEMFPKNLPTSGKGSFISYLNTNEVVVSAKKNKNKRKGEECNEESVLSPKKKSKKGDEDTPKKKSKTKLDEDLGLSNPAFNPLCTPVKVQRHILNTIQESISENSEPEDNSPEIIEVEAEVYDNTLKKKDEVEERSGTPKKKKKKAQEFEEIVMDVCSSEEKKKEKKKKNIENGFVNNVVLEDIEDTPKTKKPKIGMENPVLNTGVESDCCTRSGENPYEVSVKEKKKKKKKEIKMAIDNPNFEDTEESIKSLQTEENPYEVKVKEKKKKKKEKPFAIENPNFNETLENSSINSSQCEANPYEVQVKEKKKKMKKDKFAQENPNFNGSMENSTDSSQIEGNPYEVTIKKKSKKTKQDKMESSVDSVQVEENTYEITDKKKKKKNKELFAVDNPYFNPIDSVQVDIENNIFEVERKKKKMKKSKQDRGIVNPGLNLDTPESENKENDSIEIEESDIMLNVVTTPIITKPNTYKENTLSITKVNSVKRTKSVRFSDVTQERIIPNNDDLRNMSETEIESEIFLTQVNGNLENENIGTNVSPLNEENQSKRGKKRKLGLDNAAFDKQKNTLDENLDSISKTIDMYQAEIENDINEKKLETFKMEDIMIGEVGNPHGENERMIEGTKLKFKYAHFQSKSPFYQLNKTGSKKSYKHLIKGDIVIKFKDSNLHEIKGYAVKEKNTA